MKNQISEITAHTQKGTPMSFTVLCMFYRFVYFQHAKMKFSIKKKNKPHV